MPEGETHVERARRFTGRSTKYSEHVHSALVAATRAGMRRNEAAQLVRVQLRTFQTWLQRGRAALETLEGGGDVEDYDAQLAMLALDIEEAEAQWVAELHGYIRRAARDDWTAAMTWLERRYPQWYGRRDTTVLEGGERPLIEITIGDPKTMELANQVLRELARPAIEGTVVAED
jgi:transposase